MVRAGVPVPHMAWLKLLGPQQCDQQIAEQEQGHEYRQPDHWKSSHFVAGLNEQEHQPHGRQTQEQHDREPGCKVHCESSAA